MEKLFSKKEDPKNLYCTICKSVEAVREFKSGYICEGCIDFVKSGESRKNDILDVAQEK